MKEILDYINSDVFNKTEKELQQNILICEKSTNTYVQAVLDYYNWYVDLKEAIRPLLKNYNYQKTEEIQKCVASPQNIYEVAIIVLDSIVSRRLYQIKLEMLEK